jgi:hypothetical protein
VAKTHDLGSGGPPLQGNHYGVICGALMFEERWEAVQTILKVSPACLIISRVRAPQVTPLSPQAVHWGLSYASWPSTVRRRHVRIHKQGPRQQLAQWSRVEGAGAAWAPQVL